MIARMIAVTARTIPKTYASLAGSGFGAMCPLLARQIDVAMPDFGGATRERCVSYFTLRRLSKKCRWKKAPAIDGQGPSAPPSRVIPVSLLIEHDGLIHLAARGVLVLGNDAARLYLLLKKKMSGQERTTRIHSRNPS